MSHSTPSVPIDNAVILDISSTPQQKISIKSNISSFDKVLSGITHALNSRSHTSMNGWSNDITHKVEHMVKSLTTESEHYFALSKKSSYKDKAVRSLQLAVTGVSMYINTSNIDDNTIKHVNIGLSIFVGFLGGLEGIFRFNKHAFQYKEIALALEGLARTLRSQLLLAPMARREPSELLMFIESTRDKMLKKLLE